MRNALLTLGAALALLATAPLAAAQHDHGASHGAEHAVQTTPADGAMGPAPATFTATFPHPARLTSLVVTRRGGDPLAVTIPESALAATASVALPTLSPGTYTFTWTATGADNHIMTGRVSYMVH